MILALGEDHLARHSMVKKRKANWMPSEKAMCRGLAL